MFFLAVLARAQTPTIYDFDIPPQSVDSALNAFAEQTEFTVLYLSSDVEDAVSNGVRGTFDVIHALELLLDGTDLEFIVQLPARSIRVARAAPSNPPVTARDEDAASLPPSAAAIPRVAEGSTDLGSEPRAVTRGRMLEEVVITARRYSESVEDAPLAVSVMSEGYLVDQQVNGIQDFLELTPGTTWGGFTKAQPSFTIRGISGGAEANASREGGMSVVIDGIPITRGFMLTPTIFDMERVEVMRGPQGTTFGRNSTAGLVHLITGRPSQEFESGVTVQTGSLSLAGLNGFVSGGLSDTVSARLAFNLEQTDGGIEDADTGEALEGAKNRAFRGSLLFEPNDNFSAYLKAEISVDDELPPVRRPAVCTRPWLTTDAFGVGFSSSAGFAEAYTAPCDQWRSKQSPPPIGGFYTKREMTNATAELIWSLANDMTVTWLSGYIEGDHRNLQDNRGTPEIIEEEYVANDGSIRSTELRVDNTAIGNRLTWVAGLYLMSDEETRSEVTHNCAPRGNGCGIVQVWEDFPPPPHPVDLAAPLPGHVLERTAHGSTNSYGIFGELSFDVTDRLNLSIGGRYTDDSRDYNIMANGWGDAGELSLLGLGGPRYCEDNIFQNADGYDVCGTPSAPMGYDPTFISRSWDDFSGRLSLTYAVNNTNNLYFLFSQGFKSGGFQADVLYADFLSVAKLDNENVDNIELGWKGSYDRARFAVTLYSIEQTDAQGNVLFSPILGSRQQINVSSNFGGIETDGIELEGEILIGDNFALGGNFSLMDSVYGPGTLRRAAIDPVTGGLVGGEDISGTDANNAPDHTWVLYGDYTWSLGNGSTLSVRADIQHRDEMWGTNGEANRALSLPDGSGSSAKRPQLDNVGAQIRWTSASGKTSVTLWGKNLKDEQDYVAGVGFVPNGIYYLDPVYGTFNGALSTTGRRQVGIDATFRF